MTDLNDLIKKYRIFGNPNSEKKVSGNGQFVAEMEGTSIHIYNENGRRVLEWACHNEFANDPSNFGLSYDGKIGLTRGRKLFLNKHTTDRNFFDFLGTDIDGWFSLDDKNRVTSISLSLNGDFVALSKSNGFIYLFNSVGKRLWKHQIIESYNPARTIKTDISQDGNFIVAAEMDGNDPNIYLFNREGKQVWKYQLMDVPYNFEVSLNCEIIAVVSIDKNLYILNREGKLLGKFFTDSRNFLLATRVAIVNQDAYIAAYSNDKKEFFLINQNGKPLWSHSFADIHHNNSSPCLSISGDGNLIALGYDSEGNKPNFFILNRDGSQFRSSFFSDGCSKMMVSYDGTKVVIESSQSKGGVYIVPVNELLQVIKDESKKLDIKNELIKPPNKSETSPIVKIIINDKPIEILCLIIKKHNISLISSLSVFTGLLKDYFKGEYKAEFTILTKSIEENIPQDLLSRKDKIPLSVLSGQLAQKLENCGFSHELSAWAVNAWIKALGL